MQPGLVAKLFLIGSAATWLGCAVSDGDLYGQPSDAGSDGSSGHPHTGGVTGDGSWAQGGAHTGGTGAGATGGVDGGGMAGMGATGGGGMGATGGGGVGATGGGGSGGVGATGGGGSGGVGATGGSGGVGATGGGGSGGVGATGGGGSGGVGATGGGGSGGVGATGGIGGGGGSGGTGGSPGTCCTVHSSPGCSNAAIQSCVCSKDTYCCNTSWDSICVGEVTSYGCGKCSTSGGTCCFAQSTPGCSNATVANCVCANDPYCCNTAWDSICAGETTSLGCGTCP